MIGGCLRHCKDKQEKGQEVKPKGAGQANTWLDNKASPRPHPLPSSPPQLRSVFIHTILSVIHREYGYKPRPPFVDSLTLLSHSKTKAINYYCTIHNRHITRGNMNYVYTRYGCYGDTGYRSPLVLLLWPVGAVVLKTRRFIT